MNPNNMWKISYDYKENVTSHIFWLLTPNPFISRIKRWVEVWVSGNSFNFLQNYITR